MDAIQNAVAVFERLRANSYVITVEDGTKLLLRFSRENFHHLAGFQHLRDLQRIAVPHSAQEFYRNAYKGRITEEQIKKSVFFPDIQERLDSFGKIEEILHPGTGKIIT